MTTSSETKYLVIGSTGHMYVDSIDWSASAKDAPTIPDYDIIIVNTRSLDEKALEKVDNELFKLLRRNLVRFLDSHGHLYILTAPEVQIQKPKSSSITINNMEWSPIAFKMVYEKGDSFTIEQDKYPVYFKKFIASLPWQYYFNLASRRLRTELTEYYSDSGLEEEPKFTWSQKIYIKNRYGKPLAFSCTLGAYYPKSTGGVLHYSKVPDEMLGEITLLPMISNINEREAVKIILEELIEEPQKTLPPTWAEKIPVPGVREKAKEVKRITEDINRKNKNIEDINAEIEKLNEYKKLIYSSGKELEEIVGNCFEKLGGTISPAQYSEEEFVLTYKGNEYLVEVKGNGKSISLDDVRQLNDYLLKYEQDKGAPCRGILFGNAWRNTPLDERDTADKQYFPSNVIKRAEQFNIALVSSKEFLKVFSEFLEGKRSPDTILDSITSKEGVITF